MRENFFRGNVYYADLSHTIGSEQGGLRPVLIVQNNTGNRFSPTVICVPITSRAKTKIPTHIDISRKKYRFLDKDSTILAEQVRTIDKSRIKNFAGMIDNEDMETVDNCLKISLGLE